MESNAGTFFFPREIHRFWSLIARIPGNPPMTKPRKVSIWVVGSCWSLAPHFRCLHIICTKTRARRVWKWRKRWFVKSMKVIQQKLLVSWRKSSFWKIFADISAFMGTFNGLHQFINCLYLTTALGHVLLARHVANGTWWRPGCLHQPQLNG